MSSENCRLEGWLIKKRGDYHKNKFFHHDNMRWFKLQEVKGNDHSELALCYFKSQRDKEPRGWIYVKDVSEIVDTETSFTVVSPARTMTIEATTPVELLNWLRAMVESCPHADTSRVTSTNVRYGSHRAQYNDNSKEDEIDYDEYRPLDKDSLMRLNHSSREKSHHADPQAQNKALGDRSISLFSRNADGDKNSFYFASSGQTQTLVMNNENNKSGTFSSDDDLHYPQHHHRIVEEGEVMDELGGLQKTHSRDNLTRDSRDNNNRATSSGGGAGRGVADSRDNRDNRDREDHRMRGGGGYGGNSSTSNRLHSHISRDTPPRAGQLNNPAAHGNSRHTRTHSGQGVGAGAGNGESEEERERDGPREGRFGSDSPSRTSLGGVNSGEEGGAFDSTSSLYVHRDSPHGASSATAGAGDGARGGTGAGKNFPFPGPNSPNRPDAHLEVTTLSAQQEQERIAHSRARLREKHRKNQQQHHRRVGSGAGVGAGSGSDSESNSGSESSDSSADDYEKGSRVAATRRRVASREGADTPGMQSGQNSPAQRVFQPNTGSGNGNNSSAGNMRVPAPLGAPPRRARDAMLLENANESDRTNGSVRMSIDDVLKRRPSQQQEEGGGGAEAEAKESSPRSGGGRSLVNGERGEGNNSDEDADFDFKSERRSRREGEPGADAKESTSTQSGGSAASTGPGGSRPPRPPAGMKPPSNANIYSASAAAVIAGKSVPLSGSSGVGSGNGSSGGGGNFTFSQSSIQSNLAQSVGVSSINTSSAGGGGFNPRRGTSTPPRQAGDPGAKVDSNFVDDDWDADEDHVTLSRPNHHSHNHNQAHQAQQQHNSQQQNNNPKNSRHKAEAKHDDRDDRDNKDSDFDHQDRARNYPSTVRADPNWLDENFDDAE